MPMMAESLFETSSMPEGYSMIEIMDEVLAGISTRGTQIECTVRK